MAQEGHSKDYTTVLSCRHGRCPWGVRWGSFSGNLCRGHLQGVFGALGPTPGDFRDSPWSLCSGTNSRSRVALWFGEESVVGSWSCFGSDLGVPLKVPGAHTFKSLWKSRAHNSGVFMENSGGSHLWRLWGTSHGNTSAVSGSYPEV